MYIYTGVIIDHVGRLFMVVLSCVVLLMMLLLGVDQLVSMPDAIPFSLLMMYLGYELVHVACWVFPVAIYVALVLWAMYATESHFIYRLFHAGWSRRRIYGSQMVWIVPIFFLSVLFNLYYLPIARVQQKLLLGAAYQADATLHLEMNRFHRVNLAGEPWMIYSQSKSKQQEIYAFKDEGVQAINLVYSPNIGTDVDNKQLVLHAGHRVNIDPDAFWPITLWSYERYGLGLPTLQLFNSNDRANYEIMIWDHADMDHRLEAYNRVGRVLMGLVLTFIPLLLVKGAEDRSKSRLLHFSFVLYVMYWIVFILCRWVLMLDGYQHLYLILTPHAIMSVVLVAFYFGWARRA